MFDGDMASFTAIQSNDANQENEDYLDTREAWFMSNGSARAPFDYDTADLVVRNLTGRFDHVRNAKANDIQAAIRFMA